MIAGRRKFRPIAEGRK
jgi:hemerythrin-like domain-containing protein